MANETIPVAKNHNLDNLFEHLPVEVDRTIKLPSNCLFYRSGDQIKIRPMNLEDEKAIAISKGKVEDPINLMLSRCVEGVDIKDLLIIDKLWLIFNLRAISYGDIYKAIAICSKCQAENPLDIPLLSLPVIPLPDDYKNPTEVELPILKKKVTVTIPRVSDEVYLKDKDGIFANLWRFVLSVDGNTDKVLINKFLNDPRLPLTDVHKIINALTCADYGVKTNIKFECGSCKEHNLIDLPIGADFFTVK